MTGPRRALGLLPAGLLASGCFVIDAARSFQNRGQEGEAPAVTSLEASYRDAVPAVGSSLEPAPSTDATPGDLPLQGESAATVAAASAELALTTSGRLPDAVIERLASLPDDPAPDYLDGMNAAAQGRHFYCSDEWHPNLFRPHVEALGGALIAIGSEQGYMLASWTQPTLAWIVDYDPEIVALHEALDILILAAQTPDDFTRWFARSGAEPALKELSRAGASPAAVAAFRRGYGRLVRRWTLLPGKMRPSELWTRDQELFDRVKALLAEGRIRHARIDLNAATGLAAMATVLGELRVPLRVLYLSNAEQYWSYEEQFRENIRALPMDERSVVLRTMSSHKINGDYRYNVQSGLDYQARLQDTDLRRVYQFVDSRKLRDAESVELTLTKPEISAAAKTLAAATLEPSVEAQQALLASSAARPAAGLDGGGAQVESAPPPTIPGSAGVLATIATTEQLVEAPPKSAEPDLVLDEGPTGTKQAPTLRPCASAPAGMVCIPGGEFIRGTDEGSAYAEPAMSIWLQSYYIDTHEVTYGAYAACEEAGKCPAAGPLYAGFREELMPMNGVSWYDAEAYCRVNGKALPSETQWEKAARGTDGRRFPWGDEDADCSRAAIETHKTGKGCGRAGLGRNADVGRPSVVGSFAPNAYGVYDMAGNAYEWVADWFSINYGRCGSACEGPDPLGPCGGAGDTCPGAPKKVVRGGSWFWPSYHATTFHRRAHNPANEPFHHFGFRCAASLEQGLALNATPKPL